jgi:HK97 family phage portal protein
MGFFSKLKAMYAVDNRAGGWASVIRESFSGAWQRNIEIDPKENLLRFSAVYSCVSGIAFDIAKLGLHHKRLVSQVSQPVRGSIQDLLNKPNKYQNRLQFIQQWVTSKLLTGNTYILKVRDGQGRVTALHVLEPDFVKVLVTDSGDVYYQINKDNLSNREGVTVPATEIIHDRHICLFHPLVGISPIYACGYSATMGNAISQNSAGFFKNNAQPGGILTAPGRISDDTAARLKETWRRQYSGENSGQIAVLGDGLKFERMTVTATDAQLIEQLKWTVTDVARAFRYPLYKLGEGAPPISNNVEMLNLEYYSGCLQPLIEAVEDVLDQSLEVGQDNFIEFELSGLSRMDTQSNYTNIANGIKGGFLSPNEGRRTLNLPPVAGGDGVFLQQQNYALEDLSRLREAEFAAMESPEPAPDDQTRAMLERIKKGLLQ